MDSCNQWTNKTDKQIRDEFQAINLEYQNIKTDLKPGYYHCCLFLPNLNIAFANYHEDAVLIYKIDGNCIGSISTESPFSITSIDDKTIAVTGGTSCVISFINVSSNSVVKTIKTEYACWGITYFDGFLYYVEESKCIMTLNLSNDKQNILKITETMYGSHHMCNLTSNENRLCYTFKESSTVYVFTINPDRESAKYEYRMHDPEVLKEMGQCTMDEDRHIYIISQELCQLVAVSAGYFSLHPISSYNYRRLLSEDDGLFFPNAIDYNRKTNQFLVVNSMTSYDEPCPNFMIFKNRKGESEDDQKL